MIEVDIVVLCLIFGIIGVIFSTICGLVPGLHIYSILGFITLGLLTGSTLHPLVFSSLTVSMLVGYCLGSAISAVFFQTPDDSSVFMVFPSQKYVQEGRGYEAVFLSGMGVLVGSVMSCLLVLFAGEFLVSIVNLLVPNSLWVIATAMLFVWMSEWPKDPGVHPTKFKRLAAAWVQLLMGLGTIIASGVLGIYIFFSQLVPPERSFQTMAAAFVGLFAVPSILQNIFSAKPTPPQHYGASVEGSLQELAQGVGAGVIGGGIGMLVPALTAGVGNAFSRHAVSLGGDRSFMFSQGLSRSVYYVGAVLLLFNPAASIRRGGASLFITLFYVPETQGEILIISAIILVASAIGWFFFVGLVKGITKGIHKVNVRYIAIFALVLMLVLTYYMLGPQGLLILAIATPIGAIPLVFNTRRIHCIGVIAIPIMISLAGLTAQVSQFFGIG